MDTGYSISNGIHISFYFIWTVKLKFHLEEKKRRNMISSILAKSVPAEQGNQDPYNKNTFLHPPAHPRVQFCFFSLLYARVTSHHRPRPTTCPERKLTTSSSLGHACCCHLFTRVGGVYESDWREEGGPQKSPGKGWIWRTAGKFNAFCAC